MIFQGRLFPKGLWNVGWRYFLVHRWQTFLMVLGIALGVAVMVSIDIANASAGRAFELSAESVTGKATHYVTGVSGTINEQVYSSLRKQGWGIPAAPVISEYVTSPQLGSQPLQLLGIDPLVDSAFRDYSSIVTTGENQNLSKFLTLPGAIFLSKNQAERYGIIPGDEIILEIQGKNQKTILSGLLSAEDDLTKRTLDGIILADISTAQEITGRLGLVDRIDLIIPRADVDKSRLIQDWLPPGSRLSSADARQGTIEQMTAAFRVNLSALSMLALVVGLFLIYNTMTFSVVQRRSLFGTLRCLGVTRREIFGLVIGEALLVGIIGSISGIVFGVLLGRSTVGMVSQTINDLYFTTTVQAVGIPLESILKGGLIGLAATLITAAFPAWEAASIPPRAALSRAGLESKARAVVILLTALGLLLVAGGVAAFQIPGDSLLVGFGGTFAVVVGFALLSVFLMVIMLGAIRPFLGRALGFLGKMAPRSLTNALSRTSLAVAALMISVAVTVGVTLMIDSFRFTVSAWLDQTLQGDIYVTVPGFTTTAATTVIDPAIVNAIQKWPGTSAVDILRTISLESTQGIVQVSATNNRRFGMERQYAQLSVSPSKVWDEMQAGGVLISEPLANRLKVAAGKDKVELFAPLGLVSFPVIGVFYDYASSEGSLFISTDVYQRTWQDQSVTAIALRLNPGQDTDVVVRQLQDLLPATQKVLIRPNQVLRTNVMEVFDRTFAITAAMRLLATLVAFIGVLNTLLLLQLDKQKEAGILRAIGLSKKQMWGLTMLETGLMGMVAGILAIPTGYVISIILIYVINQRSFGWTLQQAVNGEAFLQALVIALAAALIAGIYPAWKISKKETIEVIRNE